MNPAEFATYRDKQAYSDAWSSGRGGDDVAGPLAAGARDSVQHLMGLVRAGDRRLSGGAGKSATFIRERPVAAALLAAGVGFLISRMRHR